jgi:hypothetical protein
VEEILRGDWTVRKTWQMVGKRLRERTLTPIDAEGLSRFAAGFALELTSIGFVPPGDAETPGSVSTKTP